MVVTRKGVFLAAFIPFLIGATLAFAESAWTYYKSDSAALSASPSFTKSLIIRFPDTFTPSEVNQTKYGTIPQSVYSKASSLLLDVGWTLFISGVIVIVVGLIVSLRNSNIVPRAFQGTQVVRHEKWVSGGASIASASSSIAPLVLAVSGGAALLSSSVFGGYIIAGLQVLLLSILVGILVQAYGSGMVDSNGLALGTLNLKSEEAALWQALISAQFFLFIVGLILITIRIVAF
jgi:hypothetical protein